MTPTFGEITAERLIWDIYFPHSDTEDNIYRIALIQRNDNDTNNDKNNNCYNNSFFF